MSKQSRKYLYQFIQATFGAGGDEAFDPVTSLGDKLQAMTWAPWEGGNAPDNVSARAQNPSVTTSTVLTTITEWSGNSSHFTNAFATGVTWITGAMNGKPVFRAASQSFEQSPNPALGDDTTIVMVYNNVNSATGYLYQGNTNPQLLARNTGTIEWYDSAGNASTTLSAATPHIITRYVNNDTIARLDGAEIDAEGSAHDYGSGTIRRWLSSGTGSSRLGGDLMGWFVVRGITEDELNSLEAWAATESGVVLASGFSIASPQSYATYNRTSPDAGVVRGHGTYDADKITSMDVSLDGSTWTACTLSGGAWVGEATGATGTHTFYVRGNGGVYASSVSNVKIGRVVAGLGQSNMLGSSLNKTNYSTTLQLGIYDPRPSPMGLMAGRSDRDTWGAAYDEGWIPDYLNNRYVADAIPWGFVRFAIGSTRIAFWEPTAAVDAAGFGYSVQYYAEFIRAVIASQGYDPNTYDPATDRQCVEEVYIQIGETDAKSSTTKASFKASLSAIAAQIKTDLGSGVIIRASVLQDLFTTGYVATEAQLTAIQDAVTETITNDANVSAGPDFSGYVLDTDPPEGSGNVHFYTDAQVDYAAGEWDDYPLASQPIVDNSGNYVIDANGNYLHTSTT